MQSILDCPTLRYSSLSLSTIKITVAVSVVQSDDIQTPLAYPWS